jgi:hypothetical protein
LPTGNIEIVYTGRNTIDDPVAGTFVLLIGNFKEIVDSDFNAVQPLSRRGRIIDLCQVLKP